MDAAEKAVVMLLVKLVGSLSSAVQEVHLAGQAIIEREAVQYLVLGAVVAVQGMAQEAQEGLEVLGVNGQKAEEHEQTLMATMTPPQLLSPLEAMDAARGEMVVPLIRLKQAQPAKHQAVVEVVVVTQEPTLEVSLGAQEPEAKSESFHGR